MPESKPAVRLPASVRVRAIARQTARRLVEIGRDDVLWKGDIEFGPTSVDVGGAIVKVLPPADVTESALVGLEHRLRAAGAVAVRVMPRPPAAGPDTEAATAEASAPRRSLREVVELVRQGVRSANPEALALLVEEALANGEKASPKPIVPACTTPLWPVRVKLTNWYRYRGEHEVRLGASVYGIAARTEASAERSNWQGKSSLLNAIPFALFGAHTHRTDDEWITRGEDAGAVEVELSDGSVITRARKRGKATQVSFARPGAPAANQAAAEKVIAEHVGLSERDFFSVAFVRQKEVDQLVRAKPAERLELLTGWLELGVLREAEDWVRGELEREARAELDAVAREQVAEDAIGRVITELGIKIVAPAPDRLLTEGEAAAQVIGQIADMRATAVMVAKRAEERAARLKGDVTSLASWMRDAATARQGEEAERQAAELGKRLEGANVAVLEQEVERLRGVENAAGFELKKARAEVELKRKLAAGAFDGACPVAPLVCPAKDEINAPRAANRKLLEVAQAAHAEAQRKYDEACRARAAAALDADTLRNNFDSLSYLLKLVQDSKPARERIEREGAPPAQDELRADADQAWRAAIDADAKVRRLAELDRTYRGKLQERDACRREREKHARLTMILREGLSVVGRQGAQKAVAVGELARIEADANALLRLCGIDLSVALRWGRESTTQLAATCDGCGMAFPSAKLKACTRCNAARGPKVDPKVELELSDRSGAADDLGGLAVRIAAGAWLRARRGSAWRGLVVDEPFGALDAANRRALAAHLATVVKGGGYAQALVVAHDAASMAALPERLTVIGGRDGSRIEGGGDAGREGAADLGERHADVVARGDGGGDRRRRSRRAGGASGRGGEDQSARDQGADRDRG